MPRKSTLGTYNCRSCQLEKPCRSGDNNIYCSNQCQMDWTWKNVKKPNVLANKGTNDSATRKRALIEERGNHCEACLIGSVWNNKPLVLQLDHIDGNSDNNDFNNLRLLCPNCHTQTETYGAKGKGSRYKKITKRNSYLREYKNNGPVV